MIKIITGFCLLMLAAGCSKSDDVPNGILSEDKMTGIMIDVYLTEAQVSTYTPRLPHDSARLVFDILKGDILEKHDVDDSVFKTSLEWYFERPDKLDVVYSRMVDSLNLKAQQLAPPSEPGK